MIRNCFSVLGAAVAALVFATPSFAVDPQPTVPFAYDHLTCFRIQDDSRFQAVVELNALHSEFQLDGTCRVKGKSRLYCSPAQKSVLRLKYGEAAAKKMDPVDMEGRHQSEDRICYKVKCPRQPILDGFEIEDQFGRRKARDFEVRLMCTNAHLVRSETTTTTVTVPSTTTTTLRPPDPCAVVDCAEGHFCRPLCDNPREAECVPFGSEGDRCGGFVPRCYEERCAPGLTCLVPALIPDAPGICTERSTTACASDDDCPEGEVCVDAGGPDGLLQVCVGGCRDDADCPADHACVPTPCPGPPCADQCVPVNHRCETDDDCGPGRVCEPSGPGDPDGMICVEGCHDDDDCGPLAVCNRVVCVTTPCPGICERDPDGECKADDDCPDGEVCEFLPVLAPFDVAVCVPGCRSDADCERGQSCHEVVCVTAPCPPQCVDVPPGACRDDSDCPKGQVCVADLAVGPTSDFGTCVDIGECGECVGDDECGPGLRCNSSEVCLQSCDCPECDVCAGSCVPDIGKCGECTSDEQCDFGLGCNASEVCLPSCECPECDVCAGSCVPDIGDCGECVSDNECGPDERCTAGSECKVSCGCPLCAVCAGDCVPADR